MNIRILIADRHFMFREVLRSLLEQEPEFCVVADTDDGEQLATLVGDRNPDILLMDVELRKRSGIEALRQIAEEQRTVRPIILTDEFNQGEIIQALLWGACGVLRKDVVTQLLFKSIRAVMAGQFWISRDDVSELVKNLRSLMAMVEQNAQKQTSNLSAQQQQIVEAIVAGCTNREIAKDLAVCERTVKYHLSRICTKLGVSGRMELARYSLKNKVVREA
jgi:two-component system, NarL family, nitrate/nitrite response regulator NarL